MNYSFNKKLTGFTFEQAIEHVTAMFKTEGFGIISEIDMKATLKSKIDVDFRKYKILGACNPHYAYKALQVEDKIGIFLPCNVVVQEHENGEVEISAVDPIPAMSAVENTEMEVIAAEIQQKIKNVMDKL